MTLSGKMRSVAVIGGSILLSVSAGAAQTELRCTFQSRYACSPGRCEPIDSSAMFVMLRMDTGQYGRCDGSPPSCDWYPMTIQRSGAFLNLNFSTGIQGAKMREDGSLFIETISAMDAVNAYATRLILASSLAASQEAQV